MRLCHHIVPALLVLFIVVFVVLRKIPMTREIEADTSKENTETRIDRSEFEMKMLTPAERETVIGRKDDKTQSNEWKTESDDEKTQSKYKIPDETVRRNAHIFQEEKKGKVDEKTQNKYKIPDETVRRNAHIFQEEKKEKVDEKTQNKYKIPDETKRSNAHIFQEEKKEKVEDKEKDHSRQDKDVKKASTPSQKSKENKEKKSAQDKKDKKQEQITKKESEQDMNRKNTTKKKETAPSGKTAINKTQDSAVNVRNRKRNIEEPVLNDYIKQKVIAYRKAMEYEEHLKDTKAVFADIVKLAKSISSANQNSKLVLLSFVGVTSIQFLQSWLCNTKDLGIHQSVIIVTLDKQLKTEVEENWTDIKVFLSPKLPGAVWQLGSTSLRKLQIINSLLHAGINLLLFDVQSVWFENPVPSLQAEAEKGYDMLVNLVPRSHINTGFIVLFATEKTQSFWISLYGQLRYMEESMRNRGRNITDQESVYAHLLLDMMVSRSKGVHFRELSILSYTEGIWYMLSEEEQKKTHPVVIRNNFINGSEKKIQRSKQWDHWFLNEDGTCDKERVQLTVKQ